MRVIRYCQTAVFLALATSMASIPAQTAPPTMVKVYDFVVKGATLLPAPFVKDLLNLWRGERTITELKQAAQALQTAYGKHGWGGVKVWVPAQQIDNGTVIIMVTEGKLRKIEVKQAKKRSPENVPAPFSALVPGETPNVKALDRQLQLSNENPSKKVVTLLKPGQQMGDIDATLTVEDTNPVKVFTSVDNTGSNANSPTRFSVGVQHSNLWDKDHVGSVQWQTSPENPSQLNVVSGGYRIPLYENNQIIDLFGAVSRVDNGSTPTPAGDLQFKGKGDIWGVRLTQLLPRWGEWDQRISVGLESRHYNNDCTLGTLGAAGCGASGLNLNRNPLTLSYSGQRAGDWPMGLSATLADDIQGTSADASSERVNAVRPGAGQEGLVLRMSASLGFAKADAPFQVQAKAVGQHAPGPQISAEQFGIGGANSVRGYDEQELLGDSGYSFSLEITSAALSRWFDTAADWPMALGNLRGVAFVDAGAVFNADGLACQTGLARCSLRSAGLGLRWPIASHTDIRVDWAKPLVSGPRTLKDTHRWHVAVNSAF